MSNRRDFLKTTAALTAVASVPYVFTSGRIRADGPNDRLTVASIGVGGRGSGIGHHAGSKGNMVACCDVDQLNAERFASKYDGRCEIYGDYRQVLDRDDIDAVTIGTPDHWHVKIATEALLAGKDVYCEKPLTLTIDEGKTICRVVKETGGVMQVGTQQRSEFNNMFLKAVVLAQSGRLGDNLTARCQAGKGQAGGPFDVSDAPSNLNWDMWLGQAPEEGYCAERVHHNFRWWLEYSGGQITDWGVHVADIGLWALGLDKTGPTTIEGSGTFPDVGNGYNAATDFDATLTFDNGRKIFLTSADGGDVLLEGELGRIRVSRGRLVGKPIEDLTAADQDWLDEEVIKLYRGKQPGDHMRNFFECVKDRSLPISDVFTHHRSVSACHLANITMRLGRKLTWDPVAEDFIGDDQASSMLSRQQRAPYSVNA